MTGDQVATFIDRHSQAWARRDPVLLSADHSPAGIVISPMFHRVEGRSQIQKSYSDLFSAFPDWEIRYEEPFVKGNSLVAFFSVMATHEGDFMGVRGSRRRCAFEGVSLFQLNADLLIEHERRVYDFTGLLIQLGVLRVRPGV